MDAYPPITPILFPPLRGSHHTPIRLTGVDTPACDVVAPLGLRVCALYGGYAHPFAQQGLPLFYDVAAPLGLRACALCGNMHARCGTWEPRRGDYNTGTGVNPCVHSADTVQNPEGVARIHERPHVPPLHHFPVVREMVPSGGNHRLGKVHPSHPQNSLKKFYICICRVCLRWHARRYILKGVTDALFLFDN